MPKPTRLLIVDDVPEVRQELHVLLGLVEPIQVAGEAGDGLAAVAQAEALQPDVVLLDLAMPGLNGFEACRLIRQRGLNCRVIVLTVYATPENVRAALDSGADGVIAKGAPLDSLLAAILQEVGDQ